MTTKIKGIIIWACSNCRSMMGLYNALQDILGVDVVVALWRYKKCPTEVTAREAIGFRSDEFPSLKMIPVGEDWNRGLEILNEHRGYRHLFAAYQDARNYRDLMREAFRRGDRVGVISEAPNNSARGFRHWLKEQIYIPYILKRKVSAVVDRADFLVNLSGDKANPLRKIGWKDDKIIPFGYFPPPLVGSSPVARKGGGRFKVLATGVMQWRRASDTIVKALDLLKRWGVDYEATITQSGPMFDEVKRFSENNHLPIKFAGFIPMEELISLYQSCSVYVAAGRSEPWGMRLNDALNCGAPIVVSRGMGGSKLIDDYKCGLTFAPNDYVDLAQKLRRLAADQELYFSCATAAMKAVNEISPEKKAKELLALIRGVCPDWI